MFENKQIRGVYATRFIASWLREGGKLQNGGDYNEFRRWLKSMDLNSEEVNDIAFLAMNGRLELETDARNYLKEHNLI